MLLQSYTTLTFTMSAMSLLLLVSVAIVIGQGETASYCLTDQCTTDHPPSLYEQYCCNADNVNHNIKITGDGRDKFIICPDILPLSCSRVNYFSCSDVLTQYPDAISGYYNITLNNGSIASVYCDMEGDNCDGEGGWMRVANINMTLSDATCPDGLTLRNINGLRGCGQGDDHYYNYYYYYDSCASTIFPLHQYNYTEVCGQVRGYRYGHPTAFYGVINYGEDIDDQYVAGVSITYDSNPRKHIWTYAGGYREYGYYFYDCPCNNGSIYSSPSFVGDNYYCESAPGFIDTSDILWDGQQCNGLESPCCTAPNMPWFTTTLNDTTTSDIEVRLCSSDYGATPVDIIQLYVK